MRNSLNHGRPAVSFGASLSLSLSLICALSAAGRPAVAADATGSAAATLKVGSLTLRHCATAAPWCGTVQRALDPSGRVPGTLDVYFEFYPHTNPRPSRGTLVATEGGPGFPATETRSEYLGLFAPLRATRDVVIMDNRGTGRSGAIDCQPLQTDPAITPESIGTCGRQLGAAAPLYSAALATDDLAAILDALGAGKIDLYGDSYGTFFEQAFAVRHGDKLRSIVLDGAYPLSGQDYAWYPNYAPTMRAKFDLACRRSEDCNRLPGSTLERIGQVLDSLRRAPFAAEAADGDGRTVRFTANAAQLATVMFGSSPAHASVRELDAAARAFMAGDRLPLLRLMAESLVSTDSRDPSRLPALFSSGLAAATTCTDAPQIFDMSLPPERRTADRDRAIAERRRTAPDTYAPFTIDEYRGMPPDYAFIDQCVLWPALPRNYPAAQSVARDAPYPDVPALVVSGDLDNMTPADDGKLVVRRFAHARELLVPNGFHVNALPHSRSACPAVIVRRFIETLDPGDTRCVESVPEVRLLPRFALHGSDLEPARALTGNDADDNLLRIARAAVLTVGDAIARIDSNTTGNGVGLRGGSFKLASASASASASARPGYTLTLTDLRWTQDVAVSGTVSFPGRTGQARCELTLVGPGGLTGMLAVRWQEGIARSRAQINGRLGSSTVVAETGAP